MKSLWSETEAALCTCDLALRVYTSRLLGREPRLFDAVVVQPGRA
jgi:rhamnose utilization protein RhaD (predicted bifunctional aldolase and dehydrogenase)